MERLLLVLADLWGESTPLGRFCAGFEGDIGASGHSLPLRLAGGLHALALRGHCPDLTAVYPPHDPDDAAFARSIRATLEAETAFLLEWMRSAPQTNEVRRSAVLIPAAHWLAARHPMPLTLSELGASGGLNLGFPGFALDTPAGRLGPADPVLTLTPDWQGPLPAAAILRVADRRGVDLNPVDVTDEDARLRLFSYLWPDQPARAALTRAAIAAHAAPVDRGDAIEWLAKRLETMPAGVHLIYHTIAWQYFPPEAQARGRGLIEAAGARASDTAPLAWLRFEADGKGPGAGITLRLWPGDRFVTLGRADFHGRWVVWAPTE